MRRTIAVAVGIVAVFLFTSAAYAFVGRFDERFSNRPYDVIIVNGKVRATTKVRQLPEGSLLIEMKRACPALFSTGCDELFYYWVEKREENGRLIWQAAPQELSTYKYFYDGDSKPYSMQAKVIWPELALGAWTPHLKPCDKEKGGECYLLNDQPMAFSVTVERDHTGTITGGTLENYFYTVDGYTFSRKQHIIVTYPTENSIRVKFEGYGEAWAYVDAWQEYRLEDGKIVWEICRNFPLSLDPPCAKQ